MEMNFELPGTNCPNDKKLLSKPLSVIFYLGGFKNLFCFLVLQEKFGDLRAKGCKLVGKDIAFRVNFVSIDSFVTSS